MLATEYGTASNIKSRVNRLSVLSAITSTQQRLKLYSKVPTNGLVIYCGTVLTPEGKEKMVNIDFEPFKPVNTSLYLCDNKFHTDALISLIEDDTKYGFIIVDGKGALYGTLSGDTKHTLHHFTVELPKKHNKGGQSSLRFARLRLESRHNYLRKIAEHANRLFIHDNKVNVSGLIFAGSADFKECLAETDMLDKRIKGQIIKTVDIAYGGEKGFNQAIDLSTDILANVKLVEEKKIIQGYFSHISQETGLYCYGVNEVLQMLEMGNIDTLIVYEGLNISRIVVKGDIVQDGDITQMKEGITQVQYLTPEQQSKIHGKEIIESQLLIDWLLETYHKYGAKMEIITDKCEEGAQFCKGFGGIGGILRYKIEVKSAISDVDEECDNVSINSNEKDDLDAFF